MVQLQTALGVREASPLAQALQAWIEAREADLRADYDLYADYYAGRHPTQITDRLQAFLNVKSTMRFATNFCAAVVDTLAERLNVIGFNSDAEALSGWAWDLWQANRADALQMAVHGDAIRLGDSYVMAAWDGQQVRWYTQDPAMIVPHYDAQTRGLLWLSKKWLEEGAIGALKTPRLNLYYPASIEKYRASGGVWQRHRDPLPGTDMLEPWPVPWTDARGRPLGIPFVHFRNGINPGQERGVSELQSIIPVQDLLNKTLIDLAQILDTMAWAQRWTLNVGDPGSSYTYVPGSVWALHATDAGDGAVGEFPAAQVDGPLDTMETLIQHIAAISRTPQHLFQLGGDYPSGEALKTAEAGLIAKARQRQVLFGNGWEDLVALSRRIQDEFGLPVPAPEDALVEAAWDDPESRNEKAHIEALGLKAQMLGIPKRQLWREMGYSQEEIDRMEADITDQRASDANIGAEILRRFEAGQGGGA